MMWEKVRLSEIVDTSSGGNPNRSIGSTGKMEIFLR